jgi:phosphatidylglycerol---prolipoprotein diacylglyceryl transferase
MYPDFQYLLHAITGIEMPEWLSLFKTFGFLVAMSFLGAAWATASELKRKTKLGLLHPEIQTMEIGHPVTKTELAISAVTGFLLGFKIGGLFGHFAEVSPDPMGYLFSANGHFLAGVIGAAIMGYARYAEKKKEQLPEPITKKIKVYPHELITEIVVIAAIAGLVGAKIFNALETWEDFIKDPIRSLISSSGLTFLGGLIMATAAFYYYARKHKIPFKHLCDATAPGIMLAYGLGRLGCHFSGDGDWGIFNSAYVANPDGTMRAAVPTDSDYITHMMGSTPSFNISAPSWLPDWLFGMVYPHNVGHEGMPIKDCIGEYCNVLPVSVFPTPIYEAITCVLLFSFMWFMRKRLNGALKMFGLYLMLAGVERFLVELVRVNYKYDWGFIHPTQAEILSVVLFITGLFLLFVYKDKDSGLAAPAYSTDPTTQQDMQ